MKLSRLRTSADMKYYARVSFYIWYDIYVAGYGLSEGFAPAAPNLPATNEERDIPGGDIVF